MSAMTLEDLSKQLRKIDFCMLTTWGSTAMSTRPMSNNGDVDYDGDSWFFSYEDTKKISEIKSNPEVSLSFTAPPSLLGTPGIFIAVEGAAELIDDRREYQTHWREDLERWFPQKVATPGVLLIKVHARKLQYWNGEENGTINI